MKIQLDYFVKNKRWRMWIFNTKGDIKIAPYISREEVSYILSMNNYTRDGRTFDIFINSKKQNNANRSDQARRRKRKHSLLSQNH